MSQSSPSGRVPVVNSLERDEIHMRAAAHLKAGFRVELDVFRVLLR
jgi:hypothetical protein